jgi:hypothetical protein
MSTPEPVMNDDFFGCSTRDYQFSLRFSDGPFEPETR